MLKIKQFFKAIIITILISSPICATKNKKRNLIRMQELAQRQNDEYVFNFIKSNCIASGYLQHFTRSEINDNGYPKVNAKVLLKCMTEFMDEKEREFWYEKLSNKLKNELECLLYNKDNFENLDLILPILYKNNNKKFKLKLFQKINSLDCIKINPTIIEIIAKLRAQDLSCFNDNMKMVKINFDGTKHIGITKNGEVNLFLSSLYSSDIYGENELLRTIKTDDKRHIKFADLMPDNKVVAIVVDKKILEFYDVETGDLLQTLKFDDEITFFGLNNYGSLLGVVTGEKAFIYRRDFTFLEMVNVIKPRKPSESELRLLKTLRNELAAFDDNNS